MTYLVIETKRETRSSKYLLCVNDFIVSIFSMGNFIVIPMVKLMENPEKIHLRSQSVDLA